MDQEKNVSFDVIYSPGISLRIPYPSQVISKINQRDQEPLPIQERLNDVLKAFGVLQTSPGKKLPGSKRNDNWLVGTTKGQKILKCYEKTIQRTEIEHECSILEYLSQIRFPATRPLKTTSGESIVEYQNRYYALFDFLSGYFKLKDYLFFPQWTNYFITAEGKFLGLLHTALNGFYPNGRGLTQSLEIYGELSSRFDWCFDRLAQNKKETLALPASKMHPFISMLLEKADWFSDCLSAIDRTLRDGRPSRRLIHGDFGPHNLLLKKNKPMVAIDFEFSRQDLQLVDLASALNTSTWDRHTYSLQRCIKIIRAYRSVTSIPTEELRVLPEVWQFYALQRIIYCWSRYLESGSEIRLKEAMRRFLLLNWVIQNQGALSNAVNVDAKN